MSGRPQAAVLTISDSAHCGLREDRSGPAVRERLEKLGWKVSAVEVLPDDQNRIAARLSTLADGNQIQAIFTTGGTGLSPRDVTVEATRAVVDRDIPGFGELMRARGRHSTPLAMLSRAMAGTRGRVLIVNLPGSPKGAVESLDAIAELLPHTMDLLNGHTKHQEP
ncbi:MAG: MogA/MoaB family molybdenum cofactor biosynthesis protein [Acidobacteria bacterium]|nr:MogA/MoaB family molybdenum cofactor biosynthesis protein [Acidobacteriota bacterium]